VLGVLLTGASRDGAQGLAAIRAAGGLAVVQDPDTAAARFMPEAGIAAAAPDHVLDPRGIAALLARISKTSP
jgi:two-component system chemotaxis response regulator CheB